MGCVSTPIRLATSYDGITSSLISFPPAVRSLKHSVGEPRCPANRAGTSTLLDSGALANSIDYVVAGDDHAIIGTGLVYARIHQEGGEIRAKNGKALAFQIGNKLVFAQKVTIPARPFLGVSAEDETELEETTLDFLARILPEGEAHP